MTRHTILPLALLCAGAACAKGNVAAKSPSSAPTAAQQGAAAPQQPDSITASADRGRILGSDKAQLWLLVVSDFQCPYCKQWHDETFPTLKKDYVDTGKLRIAYLNFPLRMHANAMPAAIAAMCASAQGKFWEAQDLIFKTQKVWESQTDPRTYLDSLAVAAGADAKAQRACSQSEHLLPLIQADQARGEKAGVSSTPTFFVGSRLIEGALPLGVFKTVIDSAISASKR